MSSAYDDKFLDGSADLYIDLERMIGDGQLVKAIRGTGILQCIPHQFHHRFICLWETK
jgi:hypothetical protein